MTSRAQEAPPAAAQPAAPPPEHVHDAELLDLCFLDPAHGWAVGQQGTIWHTTDAGASWQLQHYLEGCRLETVCFVDADTGWAVGSRAQPWPSPLEGIVLRTLDGGRSWRLEPKLLLSAVRRAEFFDRNEGIALVLPSALYPSGVVITADGGRSWSPMPISSIEHPTAACFLGPQTGLLVDFAGRIHGFRGGDCLESESPRGGLRAIRDLTITDQGVDIAVGDGGLLWRSESGGQRWTEVAAPVVLDWRSVATVGAQIWVAGSPGSIVLHSADSGQTWQAQSTGQSLPLQAIAFLDEQRGYAVGALGTVLKTADGGHTWQLCRAGGKRAAWLAVYSEPQDMPLELAAKLSAADGYLGAAHFVARRDQVASPGEERQLPLRVSHLLGALRCCGQSAWAYPVRERGLLLSEEQMLSTWNALHDDRPLERLQADIARQVLAWKPDIVFTHSPQATDPLARVIARAVASAVEAAGSETLSAELTTAGLSPWQVRKVFGSRDDGERSAVSLAPAEIAPRLGCTLAQFIDLPARCLSADVAHDRRLIPFDVLANAAGITTARGDFFHGIAIPPGGDCRRVLQAEPDSLVSVQRSAQQARNLKAILDTSHNLLASPDQVLSRIDLLVQELDERAAGQLLFELSDKYVVAGKWSLAAECWSLLAARYPSHPLAAVGLFRLLQLRASGEAAHRFRATDMLLAGANNAPPPVQTAAFEGAIPPDAVQALAAAQPELKPEPGAAAALIEDLQRAVAATAAQLERLNPLLYSEPLVRYPLALFGRRDRAHEAGARYLSMLSAGSAHNDWTAHALAEMWISDPQNECPTTLLTCVRAAERPYLDARLDDAMWQAAPETPLRSPYGEDDDWPTVIRLGYDGEFLYLAASCRRMMKSDTQSVAGPRPRDADLSRHDRLEICLDIDRDYSSWYELQVDERGWSYDACLGDASWNPRWFVAHAMDDHGWTVEAAIPLSELTGTPPQSGTVWAIDCRRIVPSLGFQSATAAGGPAPTPAGFALLRFE